MKNNHNLFSGQHSENNPNDRNVSFLSPRLFTRLGIIPPHGQPHPQPSFDELT